MVYACVGGTVDVGALLYPPANFVRKSAAIGVHDSAF